jgi:hypothetical protein
MKNPGTIYRQYSYKTGERNCNAPPGETATNGRKRGEKLQRQRAFFEKLQQKRAKRRHFSRNCNIFMFLINRNGQGREIATFLQTATANTFIY